VSHQLICISTKDNYYNGCSIVVGSRYAFSEKYDGEEQWFDESKKCVYIIDDDGRNTEYPKTCFKEVIEYREEKINTIIMDICMDCDKNAMYVRHTQFAGSHPYCKEHALQQKDFDITGPSDWCVIQEEVRDQKIDEITKS
jgi:hypothetical protein